MVGERERPVIVHRRRERLITVNRWRVMKREMLPGVELTVKRVIE